MGIAIAVVAVVVIIFGTRNLRDYNDAMKLYEQKDYAMAEHSFELLAQKGYKDSDEQLKKLRYDWIDHRLSIYDYNGLLRYLMNLDDDTSYKADIYYKVYYAVAELHEEKNPALAKHYFEQIQNYSDSAQRAEEAGRRAEQMGQTFNDFSDPEPSQEDKGKTLYYKISIASFDTEEQANAFKEQALASGNNVSPYVEQLEGKWQVLAATHKDRKEAETRMLSLEKMGYSPEMIIDYVENTAADIDQLANVMNAIGQTK